MKWNEKSYLLWNLSLSHNFSKKKISYVIFFVGYFFCKEQVYLCMLIQTE